MTTAKVLVCRLLAIPLSGVGFPFATGRQATEDKQNKQLINRLNQRLDGAAGVCRARRYAWAFDRVEAARPSAQRARKNALESHRIAIIGSCQFDLLRYQPAFRSFLKARRMAALAGDNSTVAAVDGNIASIYSQIGELEPAAERMELAAERLSVADRSETLRASYARACFAMGGAA